ncbi:MAG: hypothetical protein ACRDQ4_14070 [Pseudonocardiaceae bacterium]
MTPPLPATPVGAAPASQALTEGSRSVAEWMPGDSTFGEVLEAAALEVTRQEARVDMKAGQLASLAGTLATLSVGAVGAVGALAPRVGWLVWAAVALLLSAGFWAGSVVVLLRRIIRPRLEGAHRGSFLEPDHVERLRVMSVICYREALVARLGGLVLARYRAVRLAADLLAAGFVPLLLAGAVAAVPGLLRVVA